MEVSNPQAEPITHHPQEFDPEIEALRQQGWKIMTVGQVRSLFPRFHERNYSAIAPIE